MNNVTLFLLIRIIITIIKQLCRELIDNDSFVSFLNLSHFQNDNNKQQQCKNSKIKIKLIHIYMV
jgi:hypothetical protein